MKDGKITRGQPLVALVAVLVAWIGVRALVWDAPLFSVDRARDGAALAWEAGLPDHKLAPQRGAGAQHARVQPLASGAERPAPVAWPASHAHSAGLVDVAAPRLAPVPHVGPDVMPVSTAMTHQVMWMAALSHLPVPAAILRLARPVPAPFYPAGREPELASRWSGDAWLMLRRSGGSPSPVANVPSLYGASQGGAVLRYRLAPSSAHRPAAYFRATAAIDGPREREVATGLSLRPLPAVPVTASVELRASERPGKDELRPAAMLVSELPELGLGPKTGAEAYAQAGYVGGDHATAFVDGQVRIARTLAAHDRFDLKAGAGAWGGAQKGSGRLDVGPTANLRIGFGDSASARVGIDWRIRVAGDAAPASGPAMTISAGF